MPRPHSKKGKGSGEFGPNPWVCAEEFYTPISLACHVTNSILHNLTPGPEHQAMPFWGGVWAQDKYGK